MLCDVFPRLNLLLWKTDTPALQVPEAILIQTLEKGTEGLAQRRKEEYKLWENSKFRINPSFILTLPICKRGCHFRYGGEQQVCSRDRLRIFKAQQGGPQPFQHKSAIGVHLESVLELVARVSLSLTMFV